MCPTFHFGSMEFLIVKKKYRTASHKVLKRNRTLKVLNLSENKLDVQRLIVIAEALVRLRRSFAFFC